MHIWDESAIIIIRDAQIFTITNTDLIKWIGCQLWHDQYALMQFLYQSHHKI